jgi:hypothetical protein
MMRLIPALLAFITGVSAIDLWLNVNSKECKGTGSLVCKNLNPNVCCGVTSAGFDSLHFKEIPKEWNIEMRRHAVYGPGDGCGSVKDKQSSTGFTSWCFSGISGAGSYSFLAKRSEESSECTEIARPSYFVFEDEVGYDLTNIDDSSLLELVCNHTHSACNCGD